MNASAAQQAAEVAVVIVNYRTPDLALRSLASLRAERARLPNLRAVVADGGSADGSAERLTQGIKANDFAEWVTLLPLDINGGFGWASNQVILTLSRSQRPPDFIHLLNPDTEVCGGSVVSLVDELQRNPKCAVAGSQLFDAEGRAAASAFRFPTAGRELVNAAQSPKLGQLLGIAPLVIRDGKAAEVDWVTGASFMMKADALREAGLFDDGFFLYFEEVELMHRLRAKGWTVRHVPQSRVIHLEGAATGLGASPSRRFLPRYWYESRRRYFSLTGGNLALIEANLGWCLGRMARFGKVLLRSRSTSEGFRFGDLVRFGFRPARFDQTPSVPIWGEAPGKFPAWMSHR
jgi:N-acetylglucosaminyl-diphospho-decaprenol L-rhamnosyltransferase